MSYDQNHEFLDNGMNISEDMAVFVTTTFYLLTNNLSSYFRSTILLPTYLPIYLLQHTS
jgi:hypothetical protein